MPEQPPLDFTEVKAAALALSRRDQIALMRAIEANVFPPVDPADLAEARRIMTEIKSGRMKTVPMEQMLEELDRMAESD